MLLSAPTSHHQLTFSTELSPTGKANCRCQNITGWDKSLNRKLRGKQLLKIYVKLILGGSVLHIVTRGFSEKMSSKLFKLMISK